MNELHLNGVERSKTIEIVNLIQKEKIVFSDLKVEKLKEILIDVKVVEIQKSFKKKIDDSEGTLDLRSNF